MKSRLCRLSRLVCLTLALPLLPAPALPSARAQCNPVASEVGGWGGSACFAGFPYVAVARGRYISIEHTPSTGSPSVAGRLALDLPALHLHAAVYGRVWATDGAAIYAIDTSAPATPQLLSRTALPPQSTHQFQRVRAGGNFLYAISRSHQPIESHFYIFDATDPGAPVLRSTLPISGGTLNDLEVLNGFAYLSISEFGSANSLVVVDVSNPAQPAEVRRAGNSNRIGLRLAARGTTLFQLAKNSASGALEVWNIAAPADPALLSVNTTIGPDAYLDDELRYAATGGVFGLSALAYLQASTRTLRVYNASLTHLNTFTFDSQVGGLSLEAPTQFRIDAFVSRATGELARATAITAASPALDQRYLQVLPGWGESVAVGNGFAVLCGSDLHGENALSFFATPPGAPPTLIAHMRPDPGYLWVPRMLAAIDNVVFAVERAPTGSPWVIAYTVSLSPPGVQFASAFQPNGFGDVRGLDAGRDSANIRRLFVLKPGQLWAMDATNPASMSYVGGMGVPSDIAGPLRYLPAQGTPPRLLIAGQAGRTQVVSVAGINPPLAQGFIPSSADHIAPGSSSTVWLRHQATIKGYSLANPAAPAFLGSNTFSDDITDAIATSNTRLYVATSGGHLAELDTSDPTFPGLTMGWRVAIVPGSHWGPRALAWDGSRFHIANGGGGYAIAPTPLPRPPAPDPTLPLHAAARRGIAPMCPGAAFTLTAHFLPTAPVDSYQWHKLDPAVPAWVPLLNGPTAAGSAISGATTDTLTITSPGPADIGSYACRAANGCGSVLHGPVEARLGGYPNCDNSTTAPVLNVADFSCFLQKYAAGYAYANCDNSAAAPALNVADFSCFLQVYAAGCP